MIINKTCIHHSWSEPQTIHSIFIFTDLQRLKPVKMFSDTLQSLLQTSSHHHCFRFARCSFSLQIPPQPIIKRNHASQLAPKNDVLVSLAMLSGFFNLEIEMFEMVPILQLWWQRILVAWGQAGEETVINVKKADAQARPVHW